MELVSLRIRNSLTRGRFACLLVGCGLSSISLVGSAWAQPDPAPVTEPDEPTSEPDEEPATDSDAAVADREEPSDAADEPISDPPISDEGHPESEPLESEAETGYRSVDDDPLEDTSYAGSDEPPSGEYDDLPPDSYSGPFSKGSLGLSVIVGSASVGDRGYLVLGGGISYFVLHGLSVGLDADVWFLDDPTVYTTTPQLRYVLYFVPVLKPYVGTFYRHYFLTDGLDDLNSVGARVGAYLVSGGGSYLGLGAIYEKFLGCDDTYWDCDGWYPELTFGFAL